MSDIIIIGCGSQVGKTAALLDALREHGCVVLVADRAPPALTALELGAALLHDVHLPPELSPLPPPFVPLPLSRRWLGWSRSGGGIDRGATARNRTYPYTPRQACPKYRETAFGHGNSYVQ
jgi:hypothetical protein